MRRTDRRVLFIEPLNFNIDNRIMVAHRQTILAAISADRLAHAWELALSGLRRGEVAGLRWSDVDFDAKTLAIRNNRVDAGAAP
jgi:integrase